VGAGAVLSLYLLRGSLLALPCGVCTELGAVGMAERSTRLLKGSLNGHCACPVSAFRSFAWPGLCAAALVAPSRGGGVGPVPEFTLQTRFGERLLSLASFRLGGILPSNAAARRPGPWSVLAACGSSRARLCWVLAVAGKRPVWGCHPDA
jgi:hypothetical protein